MRYDWTKPFAGCPIDGEFTAPLLPRSAGCGARWFAWRMFCSGPPDSGTAVAVSLVALRRRLVRAGRCCGRWVAHA